MNIQDIEKLVKLLDQSSLTHFVYQSENETIKLSKETTVVASYSVPNVSAAAAAPSAAGKEGASDTQTADPSVVEVTASYVGTISLKDEKTGKPLIKVGSKVKKGQAICQIEAMKIYNDVTSPVSGEVLSVDVSNGQVVEFGTVIARIRRTEDDAV